MLIDYVNCWSSTLYTTFHREAILQTALEITGCSVKVQSQVQTITRAILPRNQLPSVSNSQRGWSCNQIFDSSTTFLNPLVGTNPLYGKRTVGFFFGTLYRFLYWFWEKNRLFCGLSEVRFHFFGALGNLPSCARISSGLNKGTKEISRLAETNNEFA